MRKNCSFCALNTLRNLCPADFIHPFYSHSYASQTVDASGADVSSRMYVYSPYTICWRNCLTQACATKGFAYAGLLWHDSFNSHQGRLWKMLMLPGRMKVLHLKATRPIEFDPVYCIATIIPSDDAVAMKPTASFIREKITQDAWKVFLHFQVKIRHIIGQTFFTGMYFPTCCCTEQGATCANRKMRPDDLLMHRLYKVGLRLKASESSQCCEGPAVNSAKRKKRPVVPCRLQ